MESRRTPADLQPESDAVDGGRPTLLEYAALGRCVFGCEDGRTAVGLQSQELRRRHHVDERDLEPTRRGVLDGRGER